MSYGDHVGVTVQAYDQDGCLECPYMVKTLKSFSTTVTIFPTSLAFPKSLQPFSTSFGVWSTPVLNVLVFSPDMGCFH